MRVTRVPTRSRGKGWYRITGGRHQERPIVRCSLRKAVHGEGSWCQEKIFSTGTAIGSVLLAGFPNRVAAAAENSPRRPGLAIHGGRGSPSANRKGEPHPTVMRTLAAQPRRAERLCQGTCPGPSRYSYVPSSAASQKATGSLPEGSVPLGTAGGWGGSSGRRLLRYRGRGLVGVGRTLGWLKAKPVITGTASR